jgi:IPT/TIG domain
MTVNPACGKFLRYFQFPSGFAMILTWLLLPALAAGQVSVVQVNSNPYLFIYTDTVVVPFTAAQTAGNLNAVVIGWNDTSDTIASVVDSNGNTYALAAGTFATSLPTPGTSQEGVSQVIYYAKNIKAGANTVTVTFNHSTGKQSVRVVEYNGLDQTNPLDTSVGNFGISIPADSGVVTTNSGNDLLFGAGTITTVFTGSGPGFVTQLLNGFSDIIEDQFVTATGSHNATATFVAGAWVMQLVAFRQAGQTAPVLAAPAITSLSVASSPEAGGVPLTVTGTNFAPGATVLFSNSGGVTAAGVNCSVTLLTAPNATISCLVPSFPTGTASVEVTNVDGQTSSQTAFTFTVSAPFSTAASPSVNPGSGSTNGGTVVLISGSDFAAGAKVTVGGVPADRVWIRNVNTIQASVPASAAGGADVVVRNASGTPGTLSGGYTYAPGTGISFVQVNSAHPASPAATAPVVYPLAQTAGNLNVVIIGWDDTTATVQSVTDSAGNTYALAFNPTVGTGISQAIYYAKNIVAAVSNTVTVTFSVPAVSPDVRLLEYSGINTVTPLDTVGGDSGTGTTLDSGPITTSTAGDLVIAGSTVGGIVSAAGPIFTTVTSTPNGLSVEHLVGPAAETLNATATQDLSMNWVTQAVAFRQAGVVLDFGVSVLPPTSASASVGHPATYTISVSAINGFNSPVTLSCSGLPLGSSCSFAGSVVTPGATAVTSTLTIIATAVTPIATSNVTVTGTFGSLSHSTTVGLTVTLVPDFTIAASTLNPATVAAGGSSTSTITIAPVNSFTSAVALTCSVAPAATRGPTCSFNPAAVPNGSGTSTLTVSTTAATTASLVPHSGGLFYAMLLPIGGLALLRTGFTSGKKKLWGFLFGCLLFSGLIILPACGGGSSSGGGGGGHPGTPAGTYSVTVTGTAGSLTHAQTVSVTVQ